MAATVEEKAIPVVVKQGWIKKKGMQIFTYFFITQEIDVKKNGSNLHSIKQD